MNKMIPIYMANNRIWTADKPDDPCYWFSVQYWCIQSENFLHMDLTPLTNEEYALDGGRFINFKKCWKSEIAIKIESVVNTKNVNDILDWCGNNLKSEWGVAINENEYNTPDCIHSIFMFSNSDEAVFFKLSWG